MTVKGRKNVSKYEETNIQTEIEYKIGNFGEKFYSQIYLQQK